MITKPTNAEVRQAIIDECDRVKELLLGKNSQYGNSALEPVRIFSQQTPDEQLKVRIDDKLCRILRGTNDNEDTVGDIIGYLILLRVHERLYSDAELREALKKAVAGIPDEVTPVDTNWR